MHNISDNGEQRNTLKSEFRINEQRAAVRRFRFEPAPGINSAGVACQMVTVKGFTELAPPEGRSFGDGAARAFAEAAGVNYAPPAKARFDEREVACMSLGFVFEPYAARGPPDDDHTETEDSSRRRPL